MNYTVLVLSLCLLFSAVTILAFSFLQVRFGRAEDLDPHSLLVRLFARRNIGVLKKPSFLALALQLVRSLKSSFVSGVRRPVLSEPTEEVLAFESTAVPKNRVTIALIIIFFVLATLVVLILVGHKTIPSNGTFPPVPNNPEGIGIFLGKLLTTILVYFMQFGFVAFEVGGVRENYRLQSAVKNLVVFAVAFMAYFLFGWKIQQFLNPQKISSLLDVAFNAGFASTVALIIANVITERGTILINALSSMVAAGLAYPCVAGWLFDGGKIAGPPWGFVDTAGGCVVHVLGAGLGLSAAFWIGPRSIRRAWFLLGKMDIAGRRKSSSWIVIGAFFLWFGWLGFNSGSVFFTGSAIDWNSFVAAFTNTSIGASAGGVFGLVVAMGTRRALDSWDQLIGGDLREVSHLERVVLGMMGGLVAVTANASRVEPWQALLEAMFGAFVAMTGSALMARHLRHLDDPVGAIATHGFAGVVGVIFTGIFRHDLYTMAFPHGRFYSIVVQAFGCAIAIGMGVLLATLPCIVLRAVERSRIGLKYSGPLLRLTAYEEQTGEIGAEVREPDIAFALDRLRLRPDLEKERDESWIRAVRVLALSDKSNEETNIFKTALDELLRTSYGGRPEEQTALAAIAACVLVDELPMCVQRGQMHWAPDPSNSKAIKKWAELDPLYAETLVVSISELAESFAVKYGTRLEQSPEQLRKSFRDAFYFLREIEKKKEPGVQWWEVARARIKHLLALPVTEHILHPNLIQSSELGEG